ncbi:S41 family peptidase [Streptomyces sp. NPDC001380]|uniref:S41 family peptidase n=1 Tax=Streptomyces sp. NPDC001380 TaxID=3364566 RepID=UPI0036C3F706
MSGTSRRMRQGATLSLVFGAVLATGAATGAWGQAPGGIPAPRQGAPARPADPVRLDGGLAGQAVPPAQARRLVEESGDRWAAYYSPEEYADFSRSLDGEYVGVGLWVHREQDGGVAVTRVGPGTSADRAGIRPGDRLLRIDGEPAGAMPVTEVVARLRGSTGAGTDADDTGTADGAGTAGTDADGAGLAGAGTAGTGTADGPDGAGRHGGADAVAGRASRQDPAGRSADLAAPAGRRVGSTVTLAVRRGDAPVREVVLRRTLLAAHDVAVDHPGPGVTRIAVHAFTSGVGDEVVAAVRRAAARPARDGGGLLLDLRGNSGGLVAEAVRAASAFLDGGPVGTYRVRGSDRDLVAESGGDTRTPLVVLVDGGTMSAAELLTGALQDRCRAVVVGSRTFGKGTVQEPSRLADGSVLELTVGRWYTPGGRSPDGTGIEPDVSVPAGEGPGRADELALAVLSGLGGPGGRR